MSKFRLHNILCSNPFNRITCCSFSTLCWCLRVAWVSGILLGSCFWIDFLSTFRVAAVAAKVPKKMLNYKTLVGFILCLLKNVNFIIWDELSHSKTCSSMRRCCWNEKVWVCCRPCLRSHGKRLLWLWNGQFRVLVQRYTLSSTA